MTETEWVREWGFLSSLLHARNPFQSDPEINALQDHLAELLNRITALLNLHWLDLPDGDDSLLAFVMTSDDGKARVQSFARIDAGSSRLRR